jgi:glycosyltransferase involved in cell wall biosynthesis
MKIFIGHNRYQFKGGEDVVFAAEQRLLKERGHDVISYERDNADLLAMSPVKKVAAYVRIDWSKDSYREVRAILNREKPDVAHFHNVHFMMTPAVYYACQDEGVPVVQSLHNFRLLCANALFFRDNMVCEDCLSKGVWEGIKHRCYKNSTVATALVTRMMARHRKKKTWTDQIDAYIAATAFTKNKYVQGGLPADKIVVKYHFVQSPVYDICGYKDYALYAGRLSPEKGIFVMLEAYRQLPQFQLKIVGDGPLKEEIEAYIKKHALNNVEMLGFVAKETLNDLMAHAKFMIVPSLCYEIFVVVVAESFSFGAPIIASRLGSLAEVVEDKVNGAFFESGNSADLVRMIKWMQDEADVIQLRKNARKTFEEKYSPEVNYQQLIEIYETAVSGHKGPRQRNVCKETSKECVAP